MSSSVQEACCCWACRRNGELKWFLGKKVFDTHYKLISAWREERLAQEKLQDYKIDKLLDNRSTSYVFFDFETRRDVMYE